MAHWIKVHLLLGVKLKLFLLDRASPQKDDWDHLLFRRVHFSQEKCTRREMLYLGEKAEKASSLSAVAAEVIMGE